MTGVLINCSRRSRSDDEAATCLNEVRDAKALSAEANRTGLSPIPNFRCYQSPSPSGNQSLHHDNLPLSVSFVVAALDLSALRSPLSQLR
jgi:hypothetical protein